MSEELWQRVENIGLFIGILLATFLVAFLVNRLFGRLIKRSANILNNDPTNYQFLRHAVIGLIYLVGLGAAIYTVPSLRTIANSLLAGAGILAVAVGFASQHALSNIISGVFIVIFKPYRINDRLQVRELEGIVEDITLRHTVIRDYPE
jgi:small conductance mechanosensitive channel